MHCMLPTHQSMVCPVLPHVARSHMLALEGDAFVAFTEVVEPLLDGAESCLQRLFKNVAYNHPLKHPHVFEACVLLYMLLRVRTEFVMPL